MIDMKIKTKNSGFTLIEIMIAIIIIGIGVAGLVAASANFTRLNGEGIDMSTAEFLMEQMREATLEAHFSDIDSSWNRTCNPPIDVAGNELDDFSEWSQVLSVVYVSDSDLSVELTSGTSNFIKVEVEIRYNGQPITSSSWIRANY